MSQDYIRVHKPNSLAPNNFGTPKNSKRKSNAGQSRRSLKKIEEIEKKDELLHVFNFFNKLLDDTKQKIHHDLFESVFEDTNEYFNYYLDKRQACNLAAVDSIKNEADKFLFNPICHVIPTIALFTGINFQDYSCLCENLTEKLKTKLTKHIFVISEQNTPNIKSLTSSIFAQWENITNEKKLKNASLKYLFNSIISENHQDYESKPASVIFVLKQFELIPKETIESFVSLISCYVENLPIFFIIELASQPNIIYEQLSSNVISKLCIKQLYLMSPENYLDKFLTKLFIEQATLFKLSGDILKCLVDIYYDYNYSISSFIHALKFCFYDHLQADKINLRYLNFSEDVFEFEQQEESFEMPLSEYKVNIIQNDWIKFNNQFVLACQFLFEIVKHFPSENDEDSLFSINTKSFSDFYVKMCYHCSQTSKISATNIKKRFFEQSQYLKVKNLIQIASSNTINEIVCSILNLVKSKPFENESKYTSEFLDELHDFEDILNQMKQNFKQTQLNELSFNEEDENQIDLSMSVKSNALSTSLYEKETSLIQRKASISRRASTRHNGRVLGEINSESEMNALMMPPPPIQTLSQSHAIVKQKAKKQITNLFNGLKTNMIEWLENQFSIYFDKDYTADFPSSKHFCYRNLEKVKKHLFDTQRLNIHNCLLNTIEHLSKNIVKNTDLNESPKKRSKNYQVDEYNMAVNGLNSDTYLFPLSIAFKLYLECGHLINLFDWLQAFVEKYENSDIKDLSDSKRKLMQALFFRSITELQFMGFIKPTSKKVDHVVKLTNGLSVLSFVD